MNNVVLQNFLKEYKEYLIETDHTTNVADSYCTYLRKGCALVKLGEGFLEAISTIVDAKVRAALCEFLMAKLSEAFEKETDKTVKKHISNYKSAVSMLSEFVMKDVTPEIESATEETSPLTITLPHESVYTREELLRKFYSRLSTQDRFYADACFPARLITKINARRKKLYKELSLNTKFLIDKDDNQFILLSNIDRLIIQTDGYVQIEGDGKTHYLYTKVYYKGNEAGYERFRVDSVDLISLDHIFSVHKKLLEFLTTHAVYRTFSDSVRAHKAAHPGVGAHALAIDYYENVYPELGLDENLLLEDICAFIDSLELVALHRSYNSSKSDNE